MVLTYSHLMFYYILLTSGLFQIIPLDVFCTVFSYVAAAMVLACKNSYSLFHPTLSALPVVQFKFSKIVPSKFNLTMGILIYVWLYKMRKSSIQNLILQWNS